MIDLDFLCFNTNLFDLNRSTSRPSVSGNPREMRNQNNVQQIAN